MIGFILLFITLIGSIRSNSTTTDYIFLGHSTTSICIYYFPFALNWRYYYHSIHFCTDSTLTYQQSRTFEAVVLFFFFRFVLDLKWEIILFQFLLHHFYCLWIDCWVNSLKIQKKKSKWIRKIKCFSFWIGFSLTPVVMNESCHCRS